MDKNTWIGFGLIAIIVIVFMKCTGPSNPAPTYTQHELDSIDSVRLDFEQKRQLALDQKEREKAIEFANLTQEQKDSLAQETFGPFYQSTNGEEVLDTLSNSKVRVVISNKGGVLKQAELLEYTSALDTVDQPLRLFDDREVAYAPDKFEKGSSFELYLTTPEEKDINTSKLYLQPIVKDSNKIVFRLPTNEPESWIDFEYELSEDYMLHYRIKPHNLQKMFEQSKRVALIDWKQLVPQHEKGRKFEDRYSGLQYMVENAGFGGIGGSGEASEERPVKWIAYKDQFFSTIFIADSSFLATRYFAQSMPGNSGYMRAIATQAYIPFDVTGAKETGFRFYLGPNHYNTLNSYEGLNLKEIVPLGWKIVSWINKILVIPMFDLFMGWGLNIGLVIILMTLVIKLIILPFVFVSYKSSAKMKALRPQLNEINEKYGADKMRERQQATMELYRQAGVSPMSGCLPMLFQFPVLMAMFWFFPTAIELRGRSFLWADDLSTYDAVISWGTNIPLFGDHLSLFCLLMTICNIGYTYVTMQSQATDPNMKFMKYIMYAMPIMFLFIFNDYAAGLSFYYLVSLFITILQTMIFRWTLNDQRMLAEIEANKKKRAGKPKSRFMQRLEEMQREQQRLARERAKKGARR